MKDGAGALIFFFGVLMGISAWEMIKGMIGSAYERTKSKNDCRKPHCEGRAVSTCGTGYCAFHCNLDCHDYDEGKMCDDPTKPRLEIMKGGKK